MTIDPKFTALVAAMSASHRASCPPTTSARCAAEDVYESVELVHRNVLEADPPEILLENLADLVGAAQRVAAHILPEIPAPDLDRMIRDNLP